MRSRVNLPLTIVDVQLFAVNNSSPHALHTQGGKEDLRETIRACGQATQKSTVGRAHADLHRDDNRLSETLESLRLLREYHLLSQWALSILRKTNGRSMLRRKSVATSSRRRPQVKRRWILSWVHRNSAGSPRGWTQLSAWT